MFGGLIATQNAVLSKLISMLFFFLKLISMLFFKKINQHAWTIGVVEMKTRYDRLI